MGCSPDTCTCNQDFHKCSCTALHTIYYTKGGREFWTNKKYKSVEDFRRWYEMEKQDWDLLDVVKLMEE